jgi:hypothetical protein
MMILNVQTWSGKRQENDTPFQRFTSRDEVNHEDLELQDVQIDLTTL